MRVRVSRSVRGGTVTYALDAFARGTFQRCLEGTLDHVLENARHLFYSDLPAPPDSETVLSDSDVDGPP